LNAQKGNKVVFKVAAFLFDASVKTSSPLLGTVNWLSCQSLAGQVPCTAHMKHSNISPTCPHNMWTSGH